MKQQKLILIAVLLAVALSLGPLFQVAAGENQAPLLKEETEVHIENRTKETVVIVFSGPEQKTISFEPGVEDDIKLDNGEYTYVFGACNESKDEKLELEGDKVEIIFYPCPHQPTKMKVMSHIDETIRVELREGYEDFDYDIKIGKTRVELFSGDYVYSYEACNQVFSGEIHVKKNGTTTFYIRSCEWYLDPAREFGALNPVKFHINNHASFPLILTLIGPQNYLLEVGSGSNRYELIAGSYRYSYFLDYQLHEGSMFVPLHGNGSMTLRPSFVMDNGLSEVE